MPTSVKTAQSINNWAAFYNFDKPGRTLRFNQVIGAGLDFGVLSSLAMLHLS